MGKKMKVVTVQQEGAVTSKPRYRIIELRNTMDFLVGKHIEYDYLEALCMDPRYEVVVRPAPGALLEPDPGEAD